jgi:Domain of unknown function (DUF4333)
MSADTLDPVNRASLMILTLTALLAGCGTSTVKPDGAERSVVDVVSRETGFHPMDVSCPSGIKAEVGGTFNCRFTGPGGTPYVARMRILEVDGERVVFQGRSRPSE